MPNGHVMKIEIEIMAKLATVKRQGFAYFFLHERKHYRICTVYTTIFEAHCLALHIFMTKHCT